MNSVSDAHVGLAVSSVRLRGDVHEVIKGVVLQLGVATDTRRIEWIRRAGACLERGTSVYHFDNLHGVV